VRGGEDVGHREKRIVQEKSLRRNCTYRNGHCECCVVGNESGV
jgi:hypothetical protein